MRRGEDMLRQAFNDAVEWNPTDDDGHVEIIVTPNEQQVNDAALTALSADETIFRRSGELVQVTRDEFTLAGIERPEGSPRITPLPLAIIREKLSAVCRFVKESDGPKKNGDVLTQIHPPEFSDKAIHARGNYPGNRPLAGIIEFPILRSDGSILDQPGYDFAMEFLFEPSGPVPSIPESPSRADAMAARDVLLDIVCDFPFAKPAHRSAWLASVLTPLERLAFSGPSPLFLVDANIRGSGKGLLVDTTALIASGRRMSVMVAPRNDDEYRKRITSLAIFGDRWALFDNIDFEFGGATIDTALTGTVWKDRLLGKNEIVELPLQTTFFGTGNNVVLRADTSRRVCHIRIDCPEENPEERTGYRHAKPIVTTTSIQTTLAGKLGKSSVISIDSPRGGRVLISVKVIDVKDSKIPFRTKGVKTSPARKK